MPADVVPFPHENAAAAENSEIALADAFVDRHASFVCYVSSWGVWLVWDGQVWVRDQTLQVRDMARAIVSEASDALAAEGKHPEAKRLGRYATVSGVLKLAQADPRVAATPEQWDADLMLLNTPAGIIDLRTGEIQPNDAARYCSKITGVSPATYVPEGCLWLRFIYRICDGNAELVAFLKRALGYSLTGTTKEEAFFFLYGTGQNGKSKLLSTVCGVLGSYHEQSDMTSFTVSKYEHHPADLAKLRGARLVTANETEEGRRWSESKIKAITGGDPISARFMRQDFFTFRPELKLWVAGNHRPGLRNVDKAMRRRMNLVPFAVTIPEAERDRDLEEKLKEEWPIVLRWLIDGCLQWQREGLNPPAVVRDATEEYFQAEDSFQQWLSECCEVERGHSAAHSALWESWKGWAERAGEFVGTKKRFALQLRARGFVAGRDRKGVVYNGLRVSPASPEADQPTTPV